VIGIDRDSGAFSHFDVGVNVSDAQVDSEVCGAFAGGLVFGEAFSVDGYLVGLVAGARESKRTVGTGGSVRFVRRLQFNDGAHDCGA
jgi:LytS/YehU family sensor histidine kinase